MFKTCPRYNPNDREASGTTQPQKYAWTYCTRNLKTTKDGFHHRNVDIKFSVYNAFLE
jgi:hypothetical protein